MPPLGRIRHAERAAERAKGNGRALSALSLVHDGGHAAAARIAATAQLAALRAARHGLYPAEEEVAARTSGVRSSRPPRAGRAPRRPPPARRPARGPPRGCAGATRRPGPPARGRPRRRSSAGSPSGSGSSRVPSAISGAVAQDHGGRHHARHARAGLVAVVAQRVEVLLTQHVVEVDAGAGHDHARARPVRAGDRGAAAVGVEHRDVGGVAEPQRTSFAARVERVLGQEALQVPLRGASR